MNRPAHRNALDCISTSLLGCDRDLIGSDRAGRCIGSHRVARSGTRFARSDWTGSVMSGWDRSICAGPGRLRRHIELSRLGSGRLRRTGSKVYPIRLHRNGPGWTESIGIPLTRQRHRLSWHRTSHRAAQHTRAAPAPCLATPRHGTARHDTASCTKSRRALPFRPLGRHGMACWDGM